MTTILNGEIEYAANAVAKILTKSCIASKIKSSKAYRLKNLMEGSESEDAQKNLEDIEEYI